MLFSMIPITAAEVMTWASSIPLIWALPTTTAEVLAVASRVPVAWAGPLVLFSVGRLLLRPTWTPAAAVSWALLLVAGIYTIPVLMGLLPGGLIVGWTGLAVLVQLPEFVASIVRAVLGHLQHTGFQQPRLFKVPRA